MPKSINRFFNSFPALIREGIDGFMLGLTQRHNFDSKFHNSVINSVGREYGWNHALFVQGNDGRWRKDNITIETKDACAYTVYIDWEKWKGRKEEEGSESISESFHKGREEEEGGEGTKGREGKGSLVEVDSYIVVTVPHLWALFDLLELFYPDLSPKFTSDNPSSILYH